MKYYSVKKMAAPIRFSSCRHFLNKFRALRRCSTEAAEKPKETRRQKLYKIIDGYYQDYKAVAVDTKDEIKNHPFKSAIYFAGLGILGVFHKTVPDEDSFTEKLRESASDLALLPKHIRNSESDDFIRDIVRYENKDELRYIHLGLFSLIWYADHGRDVDTYDAHCQHLQPKWLDYRDRIIDVGVLGQWVWIQQYMHDYDINEEELSTNGLGS